jgi:hypothetical protein
MRILRHSAWPRASSCHQNSHVTTGGHEPETRDCPLSPAGVGLVCAPDRSGNRRVRPVALHLRIEADSAAGTRGNLRPEGQFGGAPRASGACQWNVQKGPNNRSEEPEIEQKRPEHPKTLEHARGMFGKKADQRGGQDNHQEPSQTASNLQLPLDVFPHTHIPIVPASRLLRSLSHPADVTSWRHVGIWLQS